MAYRPARPPVAAAAPASFARRMVLFLSIVVIVSGLVAAILWPRDSGPPVSATVEISMMGYTPARLVIPANQPTTVRLVNPDTSYHTDGGGLHEFAIPELQIDVKVQPKSTALVTIPATAQGTYTFYCDVCCGGKANPAMQGTLVID